MNAIRLATKSLLRTPRRTLLTAAGLANAVIGGLLFYGFTRHTYWGLAESFARGGQGHLQVADSDWFDAAAPEAHRTPRATLEAARAAVSRDPRIVVSAVRRNVVGMLVSGERSGVFLGVGTDPSAEAALAPLAQPVAGKPLDASRPDGVVLGAPLAARLGVATGGTVTALVTTDAGLTNAQDLAVVGLTETGAVELDRTLATFSTDTALSLADGSAADVLVLALADTDDTDDVLASARRALAGPAFVELAVRPWYDRHHYYRAVKALYDRIFGVVEVLMALVTILSLSHAVAAVVAERRAEIAMLRVVGLRRKDVAAIFLAEGALIGLIGCGLGAIGALAASALVQVAGGIPMPPPPGFTVGYAAQILLDPLGFAIVLPVTFLAAVAASVLPAWRATRGELSRMLVGLCVLLVAMPARAEDWLGPPLPAGETCVLDLRLAEGPETVDWRLAVRGDETLAVTTSRPEGKRQAVLQTPSGTWFQTEGMGKPMRVGLAQRVVGSMSLADVVDPRMTGWEVTGRTGEVVSAKARPGMAFVRADFELSGGRLINARFYAPSGAIVRTAHYRFDGDALAEVRVSDAARPGQPATITLGRPSCSAGGWGVTAETMLTEGRELAGAAR